MADIDIENNLLEKISDYLDKDNIEKNCTYEHIINEVKNKKFYKIRFESHHFTPHNITIKKIYDKLDKIEKHGLTIKIGEHSIDIDTDKLNNYNFIIEKVENFCIADLKDKIAT